MLLIHRRMLDSTNLYIRRNQHILPDNLIVWSDYQTDGYGRQGHKWVCSDQKGALFSVFFHKQVSNLNAVSLAIAIELSFLLHSLSGFEFYVKLPNDIYLTGENTGKIGGIIIENIEKGCIIGIGINTKKNKAFGSASFEDIGIDIPNYDIIDAVSRKILVFRSAVEHPRAVGLQDFKKIMFFDETVSADTEEGRRRGKLRGITDTGSVIIGDGQYRVINNLRKCDE